MTYITIDEAILLYPTATEYEPEQQQLALNISYSMVNSFLDSTMKLPAISVIEETPGILKTAQVRFFQWVLESSNHGWSEELQNLHDHTAELCRKITANELIVSEIQTTQQEIGWNIIQSAITMGQIYIDGEAPEYNTHYTFKVISTGTNYVADSVFQIKRSDSDEVYKIINGSYDWQSIDELEIRFDGQFIENESFVIVGVPNSFNVVSAQPIIKQSTVLY